MEAAVSSKLRLALICFPLLALVACPVEERGLQYGTTSSGSAEGLTETAAGSSSGTSAGEAGGAAHGGAFDETDAAGAPSVGGSANAGGSSSAPGGASSSSAGTTPSGGGPSVNGGSNVGGSNAGGSNAGGNTGGGGANAGGSGGNLADVGPCGDVDRNGIQDCKETLVLNGSFDADVKSWSADSNLTQSWKNEDALGTAASGSLNLLFSTAAAGSSWSVAAASQCLSAWGETEMELGARALIVAGQSGGNAQLSLAMFGNDECAGSFLGTSAPLLTAQIGTWQILRGSFKLAAGTRSVLIRLAASKPGSQPALEVRFDDVLLRQK